MVICDSVFLYNYVPFLNWFLVFLMFTVVSFQARDHIHSVWCQSLHHACFQVYWKLWKKVSICCYISVVSEKRRCIPLVWSLLGGKIEHFRAQHVHRHVPTPPNTHAHTMPLPIPGFLQWFFWIIHAVPVMLCSKPKLSLVIRLLSSVLFL